MLILCDNKMPGAAKVKLSAYGEIVEFATEGITYDAISGHPDIFFCPTPAALIVAPNLPDGYFKILDQKGISYTSGQFPVGREYPESARYNALVTGSKMILNPDLCDLSIQQMNLKSEIIPVKQGYTRCSLVSLPNNTFITSDHGIEKTLKQRDWEVLFVDPQGIKLQGFDHGFFGGACGIYKNLFFICGSLTFFKEQELIVDFIEKSGIQVVELYHGPLIDVGTILFLED